RLHRADLERYAGNLGVERPHAVRQVTGRDKLRVFAGNQQDAAETLVPKRSRFAQHFVDGKSYAENWVIARETAVLAVVDALVGKIERRKEANNFAEPLLR